jgi:hypothetical protein
MCKDQSRLLPSEASHNYSLIIIHFSDAVSSIISKTTYCNYVNFVRQKHKPTASFRRHTCDFNIKIFYS